MSGSPTVEIVGRLRATKTLAVSFHEDPASEATTRHLVLHVGDGVLLRGDFLSDEVWDAPRRGTIAELYKDSWVRILVPGVNRPRGAGVPLSEFFPWVVLDLTPPIPEVNADARERGPRRSVYDWIRSDWMRWERDESRPGLHR